MRPFGAFLTLINASFDTTVVTGRRGLGIAHPGSSFNVTIGVPDGMDQEDAADVVSAACDAVFGVRAEVESNANERTTLLTALTDLSAGNGTWIRLEVTLRRMTHARLLRSVYASLVISHPQEYLREIANNDDLYTYLPSFVFAAGAQSTGPTHR